MHFTLTRFMRTDTETLGVLTCLDKHWYTLERTWVDNQRNVSCIPSGHYEMELVKTSRPFGGFKFSYLLKAVKGRSGILIHVGNTYHDSSGCILLGKRVGVLGGHYAVLQSKVAVREFMDFIDDSHSRLIAISVYDTVVADDMRLVS